MSTCIDGKITKIYYILYSIVTRSLKSMNSPGIDYVGDLRYHAYTRTIQTGNGN